jgi:hypothetical protein
MRIFAPAIGGLQRRTHWYYERVRGEYLNSQAYLSNDSKRKFLLENPKEQVIDKTLLSKTENVWQQRPDIVSKGAQDSFRKFAESMAEKLEKDDLAITDSYFKDAIARVIMFRSVEKLVSKAPWYDGGYRAQTVAYTISYLSALLSFSNLYLNFELIWQNQAMPNSLRDMLAIIAEKVYLTITRPKAGYANISQYAKTASCWEAVKNIPIDFDTLDPDLFINIEERRFKTKESKEVKKIDSDIQKQIFVIEMGLTKWKKLLDYYSLNKSSMKLSSMQLDILKKMANGSLKLPSENQSKILYNLFMNATKEGVELN